MTARANHHLGFITTSLGGGGAERAVANLASELARRGYRVSVAVLRKGGAYEADLHKDVEVYDLGCSRAAWSPRPIARFIRERQVTHAVSVLFNTDVYTLVSRFLFGWRARVILCFQSAPRAVAALSNRGERFLVRVETLIARHADQTMAISAGVADEAAEFFGLSRASMAMIPNPIVDPAKPTPKPVDLNALFAKPVNKVLIASGRLTKQKDYPTLLHALHKVRRTANVGLVVLGDGELRQETQDLVVALGLEDAVHFAGFQQAPLDWMSGADLFVLSSLWEGLANVVVEALWCGLPVVCTDCPYGPGEVLEGARWGRLTPPGDSDAFAEAILETLANPGNPEAGRKRALDYSVGAIADRYVAALALECLR